MLIFQALKVRVELSELIWQNICIRDKIEEGFSMLLLHFYNILAEVVLAGNFVTLREMIYLLVLVQTFVEVALAT